MKNIKSKKHTFNIFGHTGFIGSHLKKKLKNQKLILPKRNQFIFKQNLGHIIYCIGSDNWKKDPHNSFLANIGYLPKILNKNKFLSFNYISSIKVYNNLKIGKENSTLKINPLSKEDYFMIKKACAEAYLLAQKKNIKILRLTNIFGDNYKAPLALPAFIRNSVNSKKILLTINKNSLKDYLSIQDAINLIIKIVINGRNNIYNIASSKRVPLIAIAKKIQKVTKCKIILKNQRLIINEPKIDISKIKKEFKFEQSLDIIKSVKFLVEDFIRKNKR